MLNINFFTRSLLVSSFLVSLSPAHAMFSDRESIDETNGRASLTAPTLQKGYELGLKGEYLVSDDGKKYLVTKNKNSYNPSYGTPYFPSYLGEYCTFSGYANGNNEFCFTYSEGGGPGMRYNPETQQMEEDPNMPGMPGMEVFNLLVKRIIEEPIVDKPVTISVSHKKDISVSLNTVSPEIIEPKVSITISQSLSQEVTEKKVSNQFKIFKEPSVIENKAEKSFYASHDSEKGLYYGIELLTPENSSWWRQRLGCDAYMQYGQEVEFQRKMEMEKTDEQRIAEAESNRAFAEAMGSVFGIPSSSSSEHEAEEFIRMQGYFYDDQYQRLFDKQVLGSGSGDYLGAWRGFKYNLDHYHESPTWVAYVSSKPVEGPLYSSVSVTSPDIKMAMTLKVSETFYAPLGIYNSPIAQAFDKEMGIENYRRLSGPFHSAVARFVEQINPDVKEMIVRPLKSMAVIFEKMGLEFSKSNGRPQDISYPYVRCTLDFPGRWYSTPETLTDDEKEKFGESPYILIDPRTDEYHQIDLGHWFSKSPFLGGIDRDKIEAFPFFTVDVKSLGSL